MHNSLLHCSIAGLLAATASAQLSGIYTLGPSGTYTSFTAAAAALSAGVSGPVKFLVQPGTYNESFTLTTVTGASAVNTVTFQGVAAGLAKITGALGATCTFALATVAAPTGWYVLDGLEFTGGPGNAILCNRYVNDVEVRNCTFLSGHTTYVLNLQGANISRWNVHHNKFQLIPAQRGCYLSQIDNCLFHHNEFDLNGCSYGWYCINTNNAKNRCYDNLFYGSIQGVAGSYGIYMGASQYDWEVSLNTFVVNTGAAGNIFYIGGCCTTRMTNIYGNVFVNLGSGPIYTSAQSATAAPPYAWSYYRGDGNVFYDPASSNPRIVLLTGINTSYDLVGWQALSGQDANSVVANPLLYNQTGPVFDLRPLPGSPIKDKGIVFPGYATLPQFPIEDDYRGTIRDAKLDAGAYELRPVFGRFRTGCAGSGSFVPEIGMSGTLAVPSATFAVTLSSAVAPTSAALILGKSATSIAGFTLPVQVGGGCSIQNDEWVAIPVTVSGSGAGNGTATMPLPIANNTSFYGQTVFAQWLLVDPGAANAAAMTTSRSAAIQF